MNSRDWVTSYRGNLDQYPYANDLISFHHTGLSHRISQTDDDDNAPYQIILWIESNSADIRNVYYKERDW